MDTLEIKAAFRKYDQNGDGNIDIEGIILIQLKKD